MAVVKVTMKSGMWNVHNKSLQIIYCAHYCCCFYLYALVIFNPNNFPPLAIASFLYRNFHFMPTLKWDINLKAVKQTEPQ